MQKLDYSYHKKYVFGTAFNILMYDIETEFTFSKADGDFLISLFKALEYAGIHPHPYEKRETHIDLGHEDSLMRYWRLDYSSDEYVPHVPALKDNYHTICGIEHIFKNRYGSMSKSQIDPMKLIQHVDDSFTNTYLSHLQDMIIINTLLAYGTFVNEKIADMFYKFANRNENYESQYYISKKNVFRLLRDKNIEDVTFTEFAQLYATDKPHIFKYSHHSIAYDIKRKISYVWLPKSKEDFAVAKLYYDIKQRCLDTINIMKDILDILRSYMRTDEERQMLESVYLKIDRYFDLPTIVLQFLINSETYKWCQTQYIIPGTENDRYIPTIYSSQIESPVLGYLRYISEHAQKLIQTRSNVPQFIKTALKTEPEQAFDLFTNQWYIVDEYSVMFSLFTSRAFKKHFMKDFDVNNDVQLLLSKLLPARYFYSREYKRVETLVNQIERKIKKESK